MPPSPEFAKGDAWEVRERPAPYGKQEEAMPKVRYVRRPFTREPDFGVTSTNYNLRELLERSEEPR